MSLSVGDRVLYIPTVANKNRNHSACRRGELVQVTEMGTHFVLFDDSKVRFGNKATPQAIDVTLLQKETV